MGTRPGFCSGSHGLYQLSADLCSPPENEILNGSLRISLGLTPDQAETELWGWVIPKLTEITKPAEVMDHQKCLHRFKNYFPARFTLRKGNELPKNDLLKFTFNALTCEGLMGLSWSIQIFLVEKLILSYLYWNNWHCISHRSLGYKINSLAGSCRK